MSLPTLLTIKEAAIFLRVSPSTLYDLVAQKRIGSYRIAGKIVFGPNHLEAYLRSRDQPSQPEKCQMAPARSASRRLYQGRNLKMLHYG